MIIIKTLIIAITANSNDNYRMCYTSKLAGLFPHIFTLQPAWTPPEFSHLLS